MLPFVATVGPAVPATLPPFVAHVLTGLASLPRSIAQTPLAAPPQLSAVAAYSVVSRRIEPIAFAFAGRNLTGAVRSSPVCGLSVYAMPLLDTAYTFRSAPRAPPPGAGDAGGAPRPGGAPDGAAGGGAGAVRVLAGICATGVARVIVVRAPGHDGDPFGGGGAF